MREEVIHVTESGAHGKDGKKVTQYGRAVAFSEKPNETLKLGPFSSECGRSIAFPKFPTSSQSLSLSL